MVSDNPSTATFVLIVLIAVVPVLAVYVWTALALSAVFGKIGQEPWRAWVPIVNQITLVMVGGLSGWWFLLILIPGLGALAFWAVTIVAVHRINRGFGLGDGMTVLAALLFPVWASVVGFGEPRWRGADAASAAAPSYARTLDPALGATSAPAAAALSVPPRPPLPPRAYAPPPLPTPGPSGAPSTVTATPVVVEDSVAAPEVSAVPVDRREPAASAAPADPRDPTGAADRREAEPASAEAPAAPEAPPVRPAAPSAWAPPPPPAPPAAHSPTAPVPTPGDDSVFAPPAGNDDHSALSEGSVAWTPAPAAAAPAPASEERARPADEGFDQRWSSGFDEVSAISQPPQGDPVAARPVATGLPALLDDGAAGPERGRSGEQTPTPVAPPVSATPPASLRTAPVEIDPSFPAVTRAPAGPPRTPSELDPQFPLDTADEVSAVAGAPVAGAPRSAVGAVTRAEAPPADDEEFPDQTVVARRRRVMWTLQPTSGTPIDLTADVVIVGRQPASDPAYRSAQLVAVADETRTVSKTHARLELRGDRWIVTDLGSTNGVMLPTLMGTEIEAEPGAELAPGERFLLGDAAFRLVRTDG